MKKSHIKWHVTIKRYRESVGINNRLQQRAATLQEKKNIEINRKWITTAIEHHKLFKHSNKGIYLNYLHIIVIQTQMYT